jgi:hypothetical protein
MATHKPKALSSTISTGPVAYGIGIDTGQEIGFIVGPTSDVDDLLEEIGDANHVIVRFNADETDTVIWRWDVDGDQWESVEENIIF